MQRVRIRDDALICAGEYGTVDPSVVYSDGDWVAVWLDGHVDKFYAGTAFHEWELEYV